MGIRFSFIGDPNEDTRCVDNLGTVVRVNDFDSISALYQALGEPDVISVEKEQVDVSLLEDLAAHCPVHPNAKAFAACQHRHREKELLDTLNIPCSRYAYGQPSDASARELGLPVVVKSCRLGYDGKNQWVLKQAADVDGFKDIAEESHYIIEQFIPFDREVSQVSVRGKDGKIHHYPLAENHHENGVLKQSIVPAPKTSEALIGLAQANITKIMEALDYVGVMAMECFVVGDQLLVNELAPRVHNSGHWSQAGATTCQFENHVRAVAQMPLGATAHISVTGMVNLLGTAQPPWPEMGPLTSVHWYGKTVRSGRKLGHINILARDYDHLNAQFETLKGVTKTV